MLKFEFLRRLKVWQKMALMAVFMSLPIPVITYLLVVEKGKAIETTSIEVYGIEYLTPLKGLSKDLARYRGLVHAYLRGVSSMRSQVADVEHLVDERFAAAEEMGRKLIAGRGQSYGNLFQTTDQLRAIKQRWEALKSKSLNAQPEANFAEHTQLIAEVLDLVKHVAGTSKLVLDSEFDAYYLIDVTFNEIPEAMENVGILRDLGAGIAAAKRINQGELAQIVTYLSQARRDVKRIERGVSAAYRLNLGLKSRQGDLLEIWVKESESFINLVEQRLVRANGIQAPPLDFFTTGNGAVEQMLKLDDVVSNDLNLILQTRNNGFSGERNAILGLILLGVIVTALAVFFIAQGITRQTSEIGTLITQIERGNLSARAKVTTEDELGLTAMAFNEMLDNTYGLIQSREDHNHIQEAIMKLLDEVSGVARGDLTREAEVTADLTGAIADAFNYMILELRRLISQVQDVTQQVTTSATETQVVTEQLVQGSQQQAAQITNTSEALDDMSVSIHQVSEDATMSATVADQALTASRKGAEAVQNTVKGMLKIQEQVQETAR
ncbi:MAG TPA: HAMP domain-containing protein, partial [Blastocatellia bacterium]|nr:HAMP domain-containing protein [Blastocatellia bacterium]